jgi:hypothetical protein
VHFPIQGGLCTRFPIQLELRTSIEWTVEATILPGISRNAEEKDKLRGFSKAIDISGLHDVVREAGLAMGISAEVPTTGAHTNYRQFSDDILRIYVSGPDIPTLTMLDLPGLYRSQSQGQDESGRRMVEALVRRHMLQRNTIILLVVGAKINYENHIGPSFLTKEAQGRTLAVLTEPDTAEDPERPLDIVSGRVDDQHLTWHCLRNLSPSERKEGKGLEERDELEEEHFNQPQWRSIPGHQKGIVALQTKLSDMLLSAIKRESPRVKMELVQLRDLAINRQQQLGEPRKTSKDQIEYLSNVAQTFEKYTTAAVTGEYERFPELFGGLDASSSLKYCRLRATVREWNRMFGIVMDTAGKTKVIQLQEATIRTTVLTSPGAWADDNADDGQQSVAPLCRSLHGAHLVTTLSQRTNFLSIDQLAAYNFRMPQAICVSEYVEEVRDQSIQWRGREYNSQAPASMLGLIFLSQSRRWKDIAQVHLDQIWAASTHFVQVALQNSIPDHDVRERLADHIIRPRLLLLRKSVDEKLREILECHSGANTGIMDAYQDMRDRQLDRANQLSSSGPDAQESVPQQKHDDSEDVEKKVNRKLTSILLITMGPVYGALSSYWTSRITPNGTATLVDHDSAMRDHNASTLVRDSEAFYEVRCSETSSSKCDTRLT